MPILDEIDSCEADGPLDTDCLTCAEDYKMVMPSDNSSNVYLCIETDSDCPGDYIDTG